MRLQTQDAFVSAVLERLGMTQTELGVALRKPNAYQQVHGWLTGRAKLSYDDTIAMLDLCGWLNVSDGSGDELGARRDRLAELEAAVEAQGKATTMALKALASGIRRLERQLTTEGLPATAKGQQK